MSLAPVEINHVELGWSLFGYRRSAVDRLLAEIAQSFEEVWRERAELADRHEQLEDELLRHRELESLLRETLVSAERSAQELKDQARREVDAMLTEAHAEARAITQQALAERERLLAESRRVRAVLRSALATVEEVEEREKRGSEAA
jgi:cell division initiation protein